MNLVNAPRQTLGFFPTPVVELNRLSERLGGPRLLIKRDDQTGLALGGNKTRKLEFLMAEAVAQGCDTVITAGAAQSNHCRQTAAAAAAVGLSCHLVLGGAAPPVANGNLLLDQVLGATIHWSGECRKGERIPEIAADLRLQGHSPYIIPYGGSNATGALGFVAAIAELKHQVHNLALDIDAIVFASSSGGTQAGLAVGGTLFDFNTHLIGIGIDKDEAGASPFTTHLAELANASADKLDQPTHYSPTDFTVLDDYLGQGYGVVGELEREAIILTAQAEGILLDPVYTGRAMGGLLDLIRNGVFKPSETVLFWHTGGAPTLFEYAAELT